MNDKPLVSILSPCYNVEPFLPQCLDSIINQTYDNLQIVLIDDGSKDNTWAILQQYAAKDSRIEIYHQDNHGVAYTRNQLLDKIKGEYFLFVDSDDWIEHDMVEFLVKLVGEKNVDIVTCSNVINNNSRTDIIKSVKEYDKEEIIKAFLCHTWFNGSLWNKLTSVILLRDEQFHCGISYGEDALFMWHLLQHANRVVVTNEQLYHYRMNDNSISHGSYDQRKMSGHLVWETISREVATLWPQYKNIAAATYAISDMWQLYYALKSKYPQDDNIRRFQKHVRDNLGLIHRSGLVNSKKQIFAFIVAYNYKLGGMII